MKEIFRYSGQILTDFRKIYVQFTDYTVCFVQHKNFI